MSKTTITEQLKLADEKIAKLKKGVKYKTDGNADSSTYANIQEDTSVESLVRTMAGINARVKVYEDAKAELSKMVQKSGVTLEVEELTFAGNSVKDLKSDIAARIVELNNADELAKLEAAREKLADLITKEEKRLEAMKAMEDLLK